MRALATIGLLGLWGLVVIADLYQQQQQQQNALGQSTAATAMHGGIAGKLAGRARFEDEDLPVAKEPLEKLRESLAALQ